MFVVDFPGELLAGMLINAGACGQTGADLACLDDAAFREVFAGSPIKRIGRDRFVRNVMTAIGNSGSQGLADLCIQKLDDASPLVRGAAIWALGMLSPAAFEEQRTLRRAGETDPAVREEWDAGR